MPAPFILRFRTLPPKTHLMRGFKKLQRAILILDKDIDELLVNGLADQQP